MKIKYLRGQQDRGRSPYQIKIMPEVMEDYSVITEAMVVS